MLQDREVVLYQMLYIIINNNNYAKMLFNGNIKLVKTLKKKCIKELIY